MERKSFFGHEISKEFREKHTFKFIIPDIDFDDLLDDSFRIRQHCLCCGCELEYNTRLIPICKKNHTPAEKANFHRIIRKNQQSKLEFSPFSEKQYDLINI